MERNVYKIPINKETSDEDLERCIIAANRTSDVNVHRVAAQAHMELSEKEAEIRNGDSPPVGDILF